MKTPWVEAASKNRLGRIFDEILEERTVESDPQSTTTTSAHIEIQTYLVEPTVQHSDNPLQYWKVNQPRLPSLAATINVSLHLPQVWRARDSLAQPPLLLMKGAD